VFGREEKTGHIARNPSKFDRKDLENGADGNLEPGKQKGRGPFLAEDSQAPRERIKELERLVERLTQEATGKSHRSRVSEPTEKIQQLEALVQRQTQLVQGLIERAKKAERRTKEAEAETKAARAQAEAGTKAKDTLAKQQRQARRHTMLQKRREGPTEGTPNSKNGGVVLVEYKPPTTINSNEPPKVWAWYNTVANWLAETRGNPQARKPLVHFVSDKLTGAWLQGWRPENTGDLWRDHWKHAADISDEFIEAWVDSVTHENLTAAEEAARVNGLERALVKLQADFRLENENDRVGQLLHHYGRLEAQHLGTDPLTGKPRQHPNPERALQLLALAMRPVEKGLQLFQQLKGGTLVLDGDSNKQRLQLLEIFREAGKRARTEIDGNLLLWTGKVDAKGNPRAKDAWKHDWKSSPLLNSIFGRERAQEIRQSKGTGTGQNKAARVRRARAKQLRCFVCAGNHYATQCPKATDAEKRKSMKDWIKEMKEARERGETWRGRLWPTQTPAPNTETPNGEKTNNQ
jgi:hypothetical protein